MTLTLDPKRRNRAGMDEASREAFWWCGLVGRLMRRPVEWVYAVERGRGGAWHAHALTLGTGNTRWDASVALWKQRNGLVQVPAVYERQGVARYTCKEVAGDELVFSDTLGRSRRALNDTVTVPLVRSDAAVDFGTI